MSLPNRPTSPVVVLFFPVNTTFITIFPSYMVIEPDEWDIPKTLVVTATEDDIDRESPYSASFCMKLLSMDENFHRAAVPELNLSLEDNDYGVLLSCVYLLLLVCVVIFVNLPYLVMKVVGLLVCVMIFILVCVYNMLCRVRMHVRIRTVEHSYNKPEIPGQN